MNRRFAGIVLSFVTTSCVSNLSRLRPFSTDWVDDQGESMLEVEERLRNVRYAPGADVVVAVAGQNADKIIGMPLASPTTWSFEHALDARPIIARGVVVGSGSREVFALDALTGKRLWARPTGGAQLLGAGDDGAGTVVTLARGTGSTMLVVARNGSVKRQIETDKRLGDPAALSGIIFVPWEKKYVSAIDESTGDEIGRVALPGEVTRAFTIGGRLYFGDAGFVRFDEAIGLASSNGAHRISLPGRELPGALRLVTPGTEKLPPVANARDRSRLFARPSALEDSLDSSRFYANDLRLVFGFESSRGELVWVHTHASDVLGGDAVAGGVMVCGEDGKIALLDARTGQVSFERSFGEPIRSCVVRADTFRVPPSEGDAPSLAQQIARAMTSHEATLTAGQRLLVRELAALEEEGATKALVDIASDPRSAPVLVEGARAGLAMRRNGAVYMLLALAKHYDFLRDVLAGPPVGPMADALLAMKEMRGAPLLAAHLLDPASSDDDVRRASAALVTLATNNELSMLRWFFVKNRGTATSDDVASAVANVGRAILRVDPRGGRRLVESAANDPMTVPLVRTKLRASLANE